MVKLIKRKPSERLGYIGISEVKEHPWLKDFQWIDLQRRKLKAPFIPLHGKEHFDRRYCEGIEQIGEATNERYRNIINEEGFNKVFRNFTFRSNTISKEGKSMPRIDSSCIEKDNKTSLDKKLVYSTRKVSPIREVRLVNILNDVYIEEDKSNRGNIKGFDINRSNQRSVIDIRKREAESKIRFIKESLKDIRSKSTNRDIRERASEVIRLKKINHVFLPKIKSKLLT